MNYFTFELLGQLLPGGSQPLAVAAPGGVELNKGDPSLGLLLEVVLVQSHDLRQHRLFCCSFRGRRLLLVGVDKVSEVIHVPGSLVVLNLATVPKF